METVELMNTPVVQTTWLSPWRKVITDHTSQFWEIHILNSLSRYCDLDSFLREEWEAGFLNGWDANDLLCLLKTWQDGDCSLVHHGGDYEKCLSEVKAKGLIMPSKTDLYFPVSSLTPETFGSGWQLYDCQPARRLRAWSFPPSKC